MDTSIYAGSKGTIQFTVNQPTSQFVAHLVVKRTSEVVGKFSYPEREGYQLLTKVEANYFGYLTEDMTVRMANEQLRVEVKPFFNSHTAPIGGVDIARITDNTLKLIELIP